MSALQIAEHRIGAARFLGRLLGALDRDEEHLRRDPLQLGEPGRHQAGTMIFFGAVQPLSFFVGDGPS